MMLSPSAATELEVHTSPGRKKRNRRVPRPSIRPSAQTRLSVCELVGTDGLGKRNHPRVPAIRASPQRLCPAKEQPGERTHLLHAMTALCGDVDFSRVGEDDVGGDCSSTSPSAVMTSPPVTLKATDAGARHA